MSKYHDVGVKIPTEAVLQIGHYEGYKEEQDGRSSLTGGDFLV